MELQKHDNAFIRNKGNYIFLHVIVVVYIYIYFTRQDKKDKRNVYESNGFALFLKH